MDSQMPQQQLIWAVRLASDDSLPPQANSKKMVRTNIWSTNGFMIASEISQKVVESTGDWMLKIVRRLESARVRRQTAVVINYGSGCASLVLVDGAPLPVDLKSLPRVGIDMVVASINSEKSRQAREDRLDEYGVLTPSDEIKDHLNEGQKMHPEGVRIYLHPNDSDCGLDGFWGEAGERKRVYRIWSRQDDAYSVNEMSRSMEEEASLRSSAANAALLRSPGYGTAPVGLGLPQPTPPRAVGTAEGSTSPSPFKPLPPRRSAVKRTIPTAADPVALPAQRSVPSEIKTTSNGSSKKQQEEAQGNHKREEPKKAEADSKPEAVSNKKEKEDKQQKPASGETQLGFNPREIMLICRAFEGQMTDDELKRKTKNKNDKKPVISAADLRQCKKILRALSTELAANKPKGGAAKKPPPESKPKESEDKSSKKRKRESGPADVKEKRKRGRPKGSKTKVRTT